MSNTSQSLSHSRWHGKYPVVFVPKRRRKALFGPMRKALGPIVHALARQKACRILEGHVRPDHGHIGIEIPPKYAGASVIGFLKGQRAITITRQCARASASTASTVPLTARLDARWRTLTGWLGSTGGTRTGSSRSTWFSSFTNSLRSTSPLRSLSSEVPRSAKPCSGSRTSTL